MFDIDAVSATAVALTMTWRGKKLISKPHVVENGRISGNKRTAGNCNSTYVFEKQP